MISVGDKLQLNFPLKVWMNGAARELAFSELLTRPTIVSVYMKNHTGSCDRQNDQLVQIAETIAQSGYNLIALSRDSCASHGRYAAAKNIPYPLVSDPNDQFARATDTLLTKSMYGRSFVGPSRSAFVLDRDGRVLAILEKVESARHGDQLLHLITTL